LKLLCQLPGWMMSPRRMLISMTRMRTASTASRRPGRDVLTLGGAT
jgi:hypothetical protein